MRITKKIIAVMMCTIVISAIVLGYHFYFSKNKTFTAAEFLSQEVDFGHLPENKTYVIKDVVKSSKLFKIPQLRYDNEYENVSLDLLNAKEVTLVFFESSFSDGRYANMMFWGNRAEEFKENSEVKLELTVDPYRISSIPGELYSVELFHISGYILDIQKAIVLNNPLVEFNITFQSKDSVILTIEDVHQFFVPEYLWNNAEIRIYANYENVVTGISLNSEGDFEDIGNNGRLWKLEETAPQEKIQKGQSIKIKINPETSSNFTIHFRLWFDYVELGSLDQTALAQLGIPTASGN